VASLSQGRTAAAQCGLFTHKSVPVIFEPPCIFKILAENFPTTLKAQWHEGGGRILLGDNTGGVAGMQRPIRFQCAGVWVSTGLSFIYILI